MSVHSKSVALVSVIVPCRNEERYIARCLDSILASDYPRDRLEVLVVDGRSEDRTRTILDDYVSRYSLIRVLDNPGCIQPIALNIGIRAARGEILVRMDAHGVYPSNYIRDLVAALQQTGADNVGGVLVTLPTNQTAIGRAIAIAMAHPFGVGNSYFRIGVREPRWVDTIAFFCCRRATFDRVGLFDEELARNEDGEFNARLIKRGGRVLLVPNVASYYYARGSLGQVARMCHQYGYFKPLVARKLRRVMTLRQLAPPGLVLALAVTTLLSPWVHAAGLLFGATAGAYMLAVLGCSIGAWRRASLRGAAALALVFPTMHFSYGLGFLTRVLTLALGSVRQVRWTMRPTAAARGESPRPGAAPGPAHRTRPMPVPTVSVLVPCRNEESYIAKCLDSILSNAYPHDRLEVLVVDGRSEDRTREIVAEYAARDCRIRLIDNPRQITPVALNTGIRAATGEIILRMDAHVFYPRNYIAKLVAALEETSADNVGGVLVTLPAADTATARAIAVAMAHRFGVGNSHFRIGVGVPRWVDTIAFFCCRRETFDRIGLFDEQLLRNQDGEFNARLIRCGGRILLVPDVVAYYYARRTLRQVARMFYQYGYFKPLVAQKVGRIMTIRQMMPPLFVFSTLTTAALSVWFHQAAVLLLGIAGSYAAVLLTSAAQRARKHGLRCAVALTAVFPTMHVSYGVGFLRRSLELALRSRHRAEAATTQPLAKTNS